MGNKLLYPFRRIHGKLYEKKREIKQWVYMNSPAGTKYFVFGTPTHTNIGDSAIALAEIRFIKQTIKNQNRVKELTVSEVRRYHHLLPHEYSPHCHFFGMGGGTWATCGIQKKLFASSL